MRWFDSRRMLRRRAASAPAAPPERSRSPRGPASERFTAAPPRHALAARIAARRGRRLVVEIELPFALDWQPGGAVTVSYPNAPLARAAVDPAHTTRPGLAGAGCTVRLALLLDRDPGGEAPVEILLECAGELLCLQIGS